MRLTIEEAYKLYADELVRFATGLVGPADAQDAVAEAFVKAAERQIWARIEAPRPYLFQMVLNECRMLMRSASRRRRREAATAVRIGVEDPSVRPDVVSGLDVLSTKQRAVIVLTYWQDLAPSEVAARVGMGEGSVKRHLARGRAKLREVLDDE